MYITATHLKRMLERLPTSEEVRYRAQPGIIRFSYYGEDLTVLPFGEIEVPQHNLELQKKYLMTFECNLD